MNFKFSRDVALMQNREKRLVILLNTLTGEKVKLTQQCYDAIRILVDNELSKEEFLESLFDDEDKDYFLHLIDILQQKNIIIDSVINEEYEVASINVEITHRCNLCCKHCSMSAGTISEQDYLTTKEVFNVLDNVISLAPETIVITGGEPLVREDFWEIIDYIKSRTDSNIALMTNGLLIDNNNALRIVETFSQIDISIDGVDEYTCSQIRGKGVYSRVLNVISLLKTFKSDVRISLSMVETEFTHNSIDRFKEMCSELDVFPMIRSFDAVGRGLQNKSNLEIKEKENWSKKYRIEQLRKNKTSNSYTKAFSCGAGRNKFSVDYKGYLYPCAPLQYEDFKLLDFKLDNSARRIKSDLYFTDNSGFKHFLELMPNKSECSNCEFNMFCWECLNDYYLLSKNRELFIKRCELKKIEFEHVWDI